MGDKKHVGNSGGREFPTQKENDEAIRFLEREGMEMDKQYLRRLHEEKEAQKKGGEKKG